MGQPVGVSDDELVERELGVCASRLGLPPRSCAHGCGTIGRGVSFADASSRGLDYVDRDGGPKHRGGASLQDAPEALTDPAIGLWWGLDREEVTCQGQRAQRLDPDTKDWLLDGSRQLGSYLRPDVIELCAHGSGKPAPCGRKRAEIIRGGPQRTRWIEYIPARCLSLPGRCASPQNGEKFRVLAARGSLATRGWRRGERAFILLGPA